MRAWRDALLFHLFIAAAAVGVFFTLRPPELGWAAAHAFEQTRDSNPFARLGAAVCVTTFYTGALVLAYFLSEHVGLRLPLHAG